MLVPAHIHRDELADLFLKSWYDSRYLYYYCYSWRKELVLSDSGTWDEHVFASVYKDRVIGYISYDVIRYARVTEDWAIVLFEPEGVREFYKDILKAVDDSFRYFRFQRMGFSVVIGNPVERTYDRFVKKFGGRIVGTKKKVVYLIDGQYYDLKEYEILREDYLAAVGATD